MQLKSWRKKLKIHIRAYNEFKNRLSAIIFLTKLKFINYLKTINEKVWINK